MRTRKEQLALECAVKCIPSARIPLFFGRVDEIDQVIHHAPFSRNARCYAVAGSPISNSTRTLDVSLNPQGLSVSLFVSTLLGYENNGGVAWLVSAPTPQLFSYYFLMSLEQLLSQKREDIMRAAQKHGARNVRVFGSVARGDDGPESDVDFLVDMEPGRSLLDM